MALASDELVLAKLKLPLMAVIGAFGGCEASHNLVLRKGVCRGCNALRALHLGNPDPN